MAAISSSSTAAVALRLTPAEVTLLKFDPQKHRILNLFQLPLKPGTITSGAVAHPEDLAAAVKQAVARTRLRGAPVIIGFPEDKTFSAVVELPHLPEAELDQAVYWQAQEILPGDIKSFHLDWQLISRGAKNTPPSLLNAAAAASSPQATTTKATLDADTPPVSPPSSNTTTLVVAVPKSFLDPIIAATITAGLKPISCEPTSLSLARLAPQYPCLIAEVNQAASTLIIVDQPQATGLSTIVTDPSRVATELRHLADFWTHKHQIHINQVYVCGEGATSEWLKFLQEQTQLQVSELPLPQLANPPAHPIRFAAVLSLVHKPPDPPKSPTTVNLLPEDLETEYEHLAEKQNLSFGLKAALVTTIVTSLIMFAGFIMIQLSTRHTRSLIASEEALTSQTPYTDLAGRAEAANSTARQLRRLPPKVDLAGIITALISSAPEDLVIHGYTLNLSDKVLIVSGLSPTRNHLLEFKANLEATDQFDQVTVPLPTLEQETDIIFSIAAQLSEKL